MEKIFSKVLYHFQNNRTKGKTPENLLEESLLTWKPIRQRHAQDKPGLVDGHYALIFIA